MVLTKDELISALNGEVHLWLHLASKVDPAQLEYRPTPNQRSLIELLRYMAMMPPLHLRSVLSDSFDIKVWSQEWTTAEAAAKTLTLDQIKEAIAKHSALFAELIAPLSDADLRFEFEMFGSKNSRGRKLVSLVLCHYSVYRMQLFLYLKSAGREDLNTMNLWAGMDGSMKPPPPAS